MTLVIQVENKEETALKNKRGGTDMQYRALGNSGIEASVVGFGAWAVGGWMWGGSEEKNSIRAVHTAVDAGMNLIDTAPMYGFGRSEEIVGKAIGDRRDKVVLATKCGLIWHEKAGEYFFNSDEKQRSDDGNRQIYRCASPEMIRYEVEQSLMRMKTDYIDLYQTHWQDSTTPIAATMETLLALKKEGKIRAIGCCNADLDQIKQYQAAGALDCDQELYSMLDRKPEADIFPYLAEQNIGFLAYSPLSQGLLTGKVGPDRLFAEGDMRNSKPRFARENRLRVQLLLDRITPVAKQLNITLGQLTIAWTVAQPGCTHALVGARDDVQALENAKSGTVELGDAERTVIDEALKELGSDIV